MINFLTGLALVGAAVTAIACAIAKLIIENGKCRINDCPQFLASKSLGGGGSILHSPFSIHTAVFVFFAAIATLSAQKSGTNEPPNGALPPRSMPPAPVVAPVAVDSTGFSVPTNMPPVTNLCFWGVCKCTNSVSLGLAWPVAISLANDCIDLYGHWSLASNGWTRLAEVDVGSAISNAVVELPFAYFPTNAMEETAFFAAADRHDSDGDGLPDAFERLVSGSSPSSSDTDGDGLSDGDEMGEGSDPLSADSDGDGLDDAAERGSVRVLPSFEWVDTTGMQTTYGMVPDYTSWFRVGACSILNLAQGTSVCGLPCWSVMAFEDGFASVLASGDTTFLVYPCVVFPLNEAGYNYGTYLIAPYWADLRLRYGDTNSFMRSGIAADGAAVVEWHNARRNELSNDSISFQVVVPGGTGSVVRVNYLSSDFWMDGSGGAVVGVHNKRLATTNGVYCLAWDFAERGPILPQTTVEYRFGIGTNPLLADTDGDGLSDGEENSLGTNPLRLDTDDDRLSDVQELALGTNPLSYDTDGDGLSDDWEVGNGLNPLSGVGDDGGTGDPDDDSLDNAAERLHGTNPLLADSDGDGLSDGFEIGTCGTNPLLADTDGDGLSDGEENSLGTNPLRPDTDGDGLSDVQELALGTSPTNADTDGDGLFDGWEAANQLNPLSSAGNDGADGDIDGDGLSNLQEQAHGGNPRNADTDGDGLADAQEVQTGTSLYLADTDHDGLSDALESSLNLNPLQPDTDGDDMNDGWEYRHRNAGFDPAVDNATDTNPNNNIGADPDNDGLTNGEECEWGTNPSGQDSDGDGRPDGYDTDGDGVGDGAEVAQNSDPTDASDGGLPNSRIPLPFHFGDPSESHSEKYRLTVTPAEGIGAAPASFSWLNENYGECETKTAMLKPGWRYEVRLFHAGTNGSGSGYPDYDYELNFTTNAFPANVVVQDPDGLFGTDDTSTAFGGEGKVATISVYTVVDVTICKPDDSSWPELEESRVVLDDEELRIKIVIAPQLQSLAQCRQMFGNSVIVKTSGTCPSGASVPIGDDASLVNSSVNDSEIRISKTRQQLISLGLLPSNNDDGVDEMTWVDVPEKPGQDLSDSTAFSALGYAFRGKAIVASAPNLEASPPVSQRSTSFLKAAGCEVVSVTYDNISSDKRQVMNQSDYLYFSGHGDHYNNSIQGGFKPSDAADYWKKDLDVAIIAGCSVLDINDYNGNYDGSAEHTFSPGKAWEQTGPGVLLGYAYVAPGDAGGAPARIMNSWVSNRGTLGDVNAWMKANADNNAWNACAIVKDQKFVYFTRKWFSRVVVEKQKGEW